MTKPEQNLAIRVMDALVANPSHVALAFTVANFVGGDFLGVRVLESRAFKFVSWAYMASLLARRKFLALAVALFFIPKFRLHVGRKDADEISLFNHIWRYLVFRRVDLKIPERLALGKNMNARYGPWQRHLYEHKVLSNKHKENEALCASFYFPGNRMYNHRRPATLLVFTADANDAEQILSDKNAFPTRGHTGFNELVGEGLLGMISGPKHTAHRRLVTKFLSENHLCEFSKVIEEQTTVMLKKWLGESLNDSSRRVNVQYDLSMLTLDVIMKTAFGASDNEMSQHIPEEENDLAHGLDLALKDIIVRTVIPFWEYLPLPHQATIRKTKDDTIAQAKAIVAQTMRRIEAGEVMPPTMLSELIKMRKSDDEDAKGLTDSEIFDELTTIRGAGHETTSNTLSWCLLLLARNPEYYEKLRKEADEKVAGRIATFEESKQCALHYATILETLRLYPTVPSFPREAHEDVVLKSSGYDIPKGSIVLISQRFLNRNPQHWVRPDDFIPERFMGVQVQMGQPVGSPHDGSRFSFEPFGTGNRSCVGQRLAMLEAVQILATLIKNVDMKLTNPGRPVPNVAEVTLGPKQGLYFDIKARGTSWIKL